MTIRFRELTPSIGAEAEGIDLREPLTRSHAEAIHAAMDRYAVLVFHDQDLSEEMEETILAEAQAEIDATSEEDRA